MRGLEILELKNAVETRQTKKFFWKFVKSKLCSLNYNYLKRTLRQNSGDTFIENGAMHPNSPEYKVDIYKINNEINWFTGKARIKGDIWLKRVDGKKGKDPKIEILAKGNCEKQKKKF